MVTPPPLPLLSVHRHLICLHLTSLGGLAKGNRFSPFATLMACCLLLDLVESMLCAMILTCRMSALFSGSLRSSSHFIVEERGLARWVVFKSHSWKTRGGAGSVASNPCIVHRARLRWVSRLYDPVCLYRHRFKCKSPIVWQRQCR